MVRHTLLYFVNKAYKTRRVDFKSWLTISMTEYDLKLMKNSEYLYAVVGISNKYLKLASMDFTLKLTISMTENDRN